MEAVNTTAGPLKRLAASYEPEMATTVLGLVLLLAIIVFAVWPSNGRKPPMLRETIPFLSNTYQFATDMTTFLTRLQKSLQNSNIVGFYLGGKRAYVVTGVQNMQTFFRTSPNIGFENIFLLVITNILGATPDDVAKLTGDKSGMLAKPLLGTENTPGARFTREFAKWMEQSEFSHRTRGGFAALMGIMATNTNTIPLTSWFVISVLSDPTLLCALRDETSTAVVTSSDGTRTFNISTLTSLPLLQSVYTEILRLHVSTTITREVVKPLEVEGYMLPAGSLIQAPTALAHMSEKAWGVEGHPAEEFWTERRWNSRVSRPALRKTGDRLDDCDPGEQVRV